MEASERDLTLSSDGSRDAEPRAGDARPVRVAVVNHQALFARVLRLALQTHEDIEVVADVNDAFSNLASLRAAAPDVVLVEVNDDGDIPLLQSLATSLEDAKVILLTRGASADVVATAFEAGASGYLSLSVPLSDVVKVVLAAGSPSGDRRTQAPPTQQQPRRTGLADRMEFLTERELEILRRFANGESTRDIGARLGISTSTVRTHTQNILNKLGLHSKVEAAAYAARANLT